MCFKKHICVAIYMWNAGAHTRSLGFAHFVLTPVTAKLVQFFFQFQSTPHQKPVPRTSFLVATRFQLASNKG